MCGEVAERSKALRQGRNLFGGVGSNPTLVTTCLRLARGPGFDSRLSTFSFGRAVLHSVFLCLHEAGAEACGVLEAVRHFGFVHRARTHRGRLTKQTQYSTSRGARTHDHKVKSLALYRLS